MEMSGPPQKRSRQTSSPLAHDGEISYGKETSKGGDLSAIPTFEMRCLETMSSDEFLCAYTAFQAVHFKAERSSSSRKTKLSWRDVHSIYEKLSAGDKESWCVENQEILLQGDKNKNAGQKSEIQPEMFLAPVIQHQQAYCSFLVQKDKDTYKETLQNLPLPMLGAIDEKWVYEPCLWIFFGRNNGKDPPCSNGNDKSPLEGRGLHTDSVSHDGTWHYQLSGTKEWFLSPSCDLLRHWKESTPTFPKEVQNWTESTKIHVPCHEGDIIVVNTRLWFHRTVIPHQGNPSVSYARDFRLQEGISNDNARTNLCKDDDTDKDNGNGAMTNVDGLYARNEIEAGTIIFTEKDMPDCELHRSNDNPNCEVVELEDGTSAVVSRRQIACGEFFCVAESSDEEDEEELFDGSDDE